MGGYVSVPVHANFRYSSLQWPPFPSLSEIFHNPHCPGIMEYACILYACTWYLNLHVKVPVILPLEVCCLSCCATEHEAVHVPDELATCHLEHQSVIHHF